MQEELEKVEQEYEDGKSKPIAVIHAVALEVTPIIVFSYRPWSYRPMTTNPMVVCLIAVSHTDVSSYDNRSYRFIAFSLHTNSWPYYFIAGSGTAPWLSGGMIPWLCGPMAVLRYSSGSMVLWPIAPQPQNTDALDSFSVA